MARPLPSKLPDTLTTSSEIRLAYSRILRSERASPFITDHNIREKKLMHVRILSYLIREGPSMRASEYVAQGVNACQGDDEMDRLGEMYYLHYLRICESLVATPCFP